MKISIIVPDSTVYIAGSYVEVAMPEISSDVRAVQWNERAENAGHIELIDGTNVPITAAEFAAYDPVIERAKEKIAALKAPRIVEGFVTSRLNAGQFDVYRVFAASAGAVNMAGDRLDIQRASSSRRVSMVTSGARLYESVSGAFEPIVLRVGDFNVDLPDMQANDSYRITSLEDNTEYHCVSRKDTQPFSYTRFRLTSGEFVALPAGSQAFVGGGMTNLGEGPTLIAAEDVAREIRAVGGEVFGIVF